MAQRIRQHDWVATPLGDVATWPVELKTAMAFLIDSCFPGAIVWGPSLPPSTTTLYIPILGDKPDALGRSFADIWHEVWPQLDPLIGRAMSGQAVFIENFELTIERSDKPERTYFTFCYSPLRMADETVGGVMDTVVETTAAVNAEAERKLLAEELSHRLKNTISVVQAISRQTLRSAVDREAIDAFDKRLAALAKAHEILTRQSWTKASMRSIVDITLSAISDRSRIDLEGDDLELGPKAVLGVSMLLHELATNAEKYGALSNETGGVRLCCDVDGDTFVMTWKKHGGPPVTAPQRRGFGTRIIAMGLGGDVDTDFRPDGLTVRVEADVAELQHV